ncbi:VanZ like family protein [Lentzea fradiae]|uniref:VanZ like family protein n=1 Tax=Lentzea fradiae TaxID=200378 RepID=A0A1G7PTS7_9PSEU|nr:VanZ family protein [Lentzea fradiae]SDF89732.1 VanZ like family protein [Lentzea fradiae]
MTNAQLASIQWGILISVVLLLPQLMFGRLTFRGAAVTGYASMLFAATFLPIQTIAPRQSVQLVPFQWVADTFRDGRIAFDQMTLNVLLFVPLGVMLLCWGRRTAGQAALAGFGVSLAIEGAQLLWANRIFDVDDLVANTTGTALGWLTALAAVKAYDRVTTVAVPQPLTGVR